LKDDFDIFKENSNQPTILNFENIEVTDRVLDLDMSASRNNASISGIAIEAKSIFPALKLNQTVWVDYVDVQKLEPEELIRLYPNPADTETVISLGKDIDIDSILFYNTAGQLVKKISLFHK